MSQWLLNPRAYLTVYKTGMTSVMLFMAVSVNAAPTTNAVDATAPTSASTTPVPAEQQATTANTVAGTSNTLLAAQLQPSTQSLSDANQALLSRNAQLQREVNDLQTQANVLVYESKGQLFLYGAFTVLISLLVGIFISWLVFIRRDRW
ncbi:hypothetical protein [Psychrobacter sp. JB385]|uniref:hypothetical protein n=1 Tax=Psychrobacter sp. JB385 TaxID=1434841 RepID=UPI00097F3EA0|nr:hypothetical protein [Psychrobacter sp. JB385]SJN16875.1 hypothetical protein CZ794_01225 [Psychrobacter sp. JB385]